MRSVDPKVRKAQIIERIGAQREMRRARRAAMRLERVAVEKEAAAAVAEGRGTFMQNPAVRMVMQHPYAAGGIAALALMLGPRKLLRWGSWVLPLVARFKR